MEKKKLSVAEKKALGQEYYDIEGKYHIDGYLSSVWTVLFHSASLNKYPKDPQHSLNAIDMLIAEAEKVIGHSVEPAPISTFIYEGDRANADFAPREAKIFALLKERDRYDAEQIECFRQGKGHYYSDGDHEWTTYMHIGERGAFPFANLTLVDIEEGVVRRGEFVGVGDGAVIPFMCSGEYDRDVGHLLKEKRIKIVAEKVKQEGLDALGKQKKQEVIEKIRKDPKVPDFVKKNVEKLFDPENRKIIKEWYKKLNDKTRGL